MNLPAELAEQIASHQIKKALLEMEKIKAEIPSHLVDKLASPEQIAAAVKSPRSDRLRTSKPAKASADIKCAWRWCRFHAGEDTTMPTTCAFDAYDWVKEQDESLNHIRVGRFVEKYMIEAATIAVILLGLNPMRGTMRWGRALGLI